MAARDPYEVLGLKPGASEAEIRAAYRRLAKQHHPDLNPGNRKAEERFKEISAANELLSDVEKRARYDRGEIDAAGQERAPPQPKWRSRAEAPGGARYAYSGPDGPAGGFDEAEIGDIFADLFRRGGPAAARPRGRGGDVNYTLAIDFLDAVNGATRRLTLPGGRHLDVRVPPGITEGQVLRLKGQGEPGARGGASGDALIAIHIEPHPLFRREGNDIHFEVPVSLVEAVLGGRITVPTPSGPVTVNVPRHSDSGTKLRLRGKGVAAHGGQPAGDAYVTLAVRVGPADVALEKFVEGWAAGKRHNPREGLKGA